MPEPQFTVWLPFDINATDETLPAAILALVASIEDQTAERVSRRPYRFIETRDWYDQLNGGGRRITHLG